MSKGLRGGFILKVRDSAGKVLCDYITLVANSFGIIFAEFLTDTFVLLQSMVFSLYFCAVSIEVRSCFGPEKKGTFKEIHYFCRQYYRLLCKSTLAVTFMTLVWFSWELDWVHLLCIPLLL